MKTLWIIGIALISVVSLSVHAKNVMSGSNGLIEPDGVFQTTVCESDSVFKITGGERKGTNLFHSFNRFSVEEGQTALFLNDSNASTVNIITRVTGKIRSKIDGTIQANDASGFKNINFFLLNPAGVTLGSDVTLNIEGSVHISTADYIRLKDGKIFKVDLNEKSTLSTASVVAFGFLKSEDKVVKPSSVLVMEDSELELEEGKTLSLVGGDILITESELIAQGGNINIVSAGNGEEVVLDPTSMKVLRTDRPFNLATKIDITDSIIDVSSDSLKRGSIIIRSGKLTIDDESEISATGFGGGTPGTIDLEFKEMSLSEESIFDVSGIGKRISDSKDSKTFEGGLISIKGDKISLDGESELLARGSGDRNAGKVSLDIEELYMSESSTIDVGATSESTAGILDITATKTVSLTGEDTGIFAGNSGSNIAGRITIKTPDLKVLDESEIRANSSGEGAAGIINLKVKELSLEGDSRITAPTSNTGTGGAIVISGYNGKEAAEKIILNQGKINVNTGFSGAGGNIDIKANQVIIENEGAITAESASNFNNAGNAGNIILHTDKLIVQSRGSISLNTSNDGNAGNVILKTNQLLVQNGGIISSQTSNDGNAGNIEITVKNQAILSNRGSISSKSDGLGNAGNIKFKITKLQLDNSNITTEAIKSDGGDITIEGNSPAKLVSLNNDSAITATVGGGAQTIGGNINIDSNLIVVQNSNIIAEASEGAGGNIDINTQGLFVDPDSRISASSQLGVDGIVEIDSDIEVLDGVLGLPETYMSNLRLRQQRCSQRLGGGKGSSFTTVEKPGMAITPETFLSGDYNTNSNSETHFSKAALDIKSLASLNEQYKFNCRN